MNRNITTIFLLILILATVFASSISDFNINSGATYATLTGVTLNYTLSIDTNCEICFSETNDNETCLARSACAGSSSSFTLSSTNAAKNVYAFVYDNNAYTTSTATDSITLDNAKPVCSITNPTITDFNTLVGIEAFDFNCTDSTAGIDQSYAKINSNNINDGNTLTWLVANTTYAITVDANDLAGNSATQVTLTLKYDTTAPTGTFTTNRYTNDKTPDLNFSSSETTTGWKIILSCNNSSWTAEKTYATGINDFDITSSSYGCDISNEETGKKIYAKFKDKAGNWSSALNKDIGYDTEDPSEPTDFKVVAGNEEANLTWTEPSSDNFSGNDIIEIYMNGDLEDTVDPEDEEITIDNLDNGDDYDFKIRTKDNAGNYSDFTEEITITPQATSTTIKLTPDVEYVKNGDKINVKCTYSDNADNAFLYFRYSTPSTTREDLDEGDNVTSLESNYTVNDIVKHDRITFYCIADGSNGAEDYVKIDNNKPFMEWKDTNNLFVGLKRVTFRATDNLILVKVEIDFNNSLKTVTTKDTNGNYYYDLNSALFENGSYTLKAIATDGATNKTEITRTVTLDNYISPKQVAEKAINEAKEKQKTAIDLIKYYTAQALTIPSELNTKKISADALLAQAINELLTQPEKANTDATSATTLFTEFNTNATTQVKETKVYVGDLNNSLEILQKYGFSAEDATLQIATMKSSGITRKLVIVQTGTSGNRQIKIELIFTNDTNSNIVKIVEIIPKELTESAKNIISDANFRIIKDDPIIEFTVPLAKGATTTLSYGIGEITSIKAQEMIDKNVITLFETAPIVLEGNLTTENMMRNITGGNEFLLLIIGLLIVLILIAGIVLFIKFKMPGHGFGEEKTIIEHLTPEQQASKKKFEAFKK